jgi:polysaccharide biosynthesis protein PslH
MRLIIISYEFPLPANHGAKVDIWNRIEALSASGVQIYLISWRGTKNKTEPTMRDIPRVKEKVLELEIFNLDKSIQRLARIIKYPSHVASRVVAESHFEKIIEKMQLFKPDAVLVDSIYGGLTGRNISNKLGIPMAVRLHNIEHKYMFGQFKLAKNPLEKLSILVSLLHLKKFELNLIRSAVAFFDISTADLGYWKSQGLTHGHWLPPVFQLEQSEPHIDTNKMDSVYDIGFLGNLNTPNNVNGLNWFIKKVYPIIKISIPEVNFIVMGSNPNQKIIDICNANDSITLVANPVDPRSYFGITKVLINPVQFGSGVNIKSIELLNTPNQIITTSAGIKGLPTEFNDLFFVTDNYIEFAETAISIIKYDHKKDNHKLRFEIQKVFHYEAVRKIEEIIMR